MKAGLMRWIGFIVVAAVVSDAVEALAVEGTLGYEGGISAVNVSEDDEYYYTEMCFLTGKPIFLSGTLTIVKRVRNDIETATYTYSLENAEEAAALRRVVIYETVSDTKVNGQITESTRLTRLPTERITIGGDIYT